MIEPPTLRLYTCESCGKEWVQRPKVIYGKDGLKITKIDISNDPQNCTKCKSPTWDIPRE